MGRLTDRVYESKATPFVLGGLSALTISLSVYAFTVNREDLGMVLPWLIFGFFDFYRDWKKDKN